MFAQIDKNKYKALWFNITITSAKIEKKEINSNCLKKNVKDCEQDKHNTPKAHCI